MNNLKRVLSLALSTVILVGMMAVGASAATFTDAKDIKNTDAVNFMVALNIINGNDDGSFAPERVVTRAEMAKMITVALNGGKDPVLGTLANPTYTDIKGHWAEKYIEYCSNLGIISGRGDGTFDPGATVTGTEAAKMMLVAMGYNSTIHNFTGADWALHVNTAANDATPNSLYKGLESIDPSAGLSRENAAQLLYNGVQDDMMKRSDSLTVDDGKVSYGYEKYKDHSILTEKYGYTVGYTFIEDVAFVEDDKTFDVSVAADDGTFNAKIAGTNDKLDADTITVKDDVSALFGQQVKVVHNGDNEAVGVYAVESSILATVVVNDLPEMDADATTAKIGGTTYRFDGTNKQAQNVPVYSFLNGVMEDVTLDILADAEGINKEFAIDLIDNDGNGRINCVVVHPVTVGKVTYLGKDSITISNGVGGRDLEDEINVYEGVKKNDYVIVTAADNTVDGKMALVKAETLSGTVDAVRASAADDTDKTNIRIDGTWYAVAEGKLTHTTPTINSDVDLVLVNGFYAYSETSKTTSKDLLVVTKLGSQQDFNDTWTAKIALMDGTTATADIEIDEDVADFEIDDADTSNLVGKLFTYEKDGSTYVLTPATADNTGYDDEISNVTFDADKDRLGDSTFTYIADDAVVFVLYNAGSDKNAKTDYVAATNMDDLSKVSVITGKSLKAWDKDVSSTGKFGTAASTVGFSDDSNGLAYAKVLVVAFDHKELPGASGDIKYGYIVAKSYQAKESSTTYTYFDLWNGEDIVTVKEKGAKKYSAGTAVSYKDLGGDEVGTVTAITTTGAVVGYSEADELINIKTTVDADTEISKKIDEDTTILYIDSANKKGAEGDGIELATETAEGKVEQNVIYKVNSGDTAIEAIFVDVSNKLDGKPAVGVATPDPDAPVPTVTLAAADSNGITVTGTSKALEEGKTVTAAGTSFVDGSADSVKFTVAASDGETIKNLKVKVGDGTAADYTSGDAVDLGDSAGAVTLVITLTSSKTDCTDKTCTYTVTFTSEA